MCITWLKPRAPYSAVVCCQPEFLLQSEFCVLSPRRSNLFIICLLGALSVVSPFAIDAYLPVVPEIGAHYHVSSAAVALTLSAYFVGMALGQIFYGPLLDRFGRKKPLYAGLAIFVLASFACTIAPSIDALIFIRLVQALGGCVAAVASLAMVRDFFPASECARIISRLFLFIALAPMLAPATGGALAIAFGWQSVFILLGSVVALILAVCFFLLPEGHAPDTDISLKPWPILKEYGSILCHPRFATYAFAGAFAFAGNFTYIAGSPIIFMENFGVSPQTYAGIFALNASGFIGGSQLNVMLLRKFDSDRILFTMVIVQTIIGAIFLAGTLTFGYGLIGTMVLLYAFLFCSGVNNPNAAALALTPFSKNAGSAAALLGFLQLGIGAVISTAIGLLETRDSLPVIAILAATAFCGLCVLLLGRKRALAAAPVEHPA